MLAPGQSYLICAVDDEVYNIWPMDPERYLGNRTGYLEMFAKADLQIHFESTEWGNFPAEYDSVSPYGRDLMDNWNGRAAYYIMHYFKETELERDSIIVDAFNAAYTSETSPFKSVGASDAAGVVGATGNRILVRKATVTEGTGDALDFLDPDCWRRHYRLGMAAPEVPPGRMESAGKTLLDHWQSWQLHPEHRIPQG